MGLTKIRLKEIIREEIQKLGEYKYWKYEMSPKEDDAMNNATFDLEKKFKGKQNNIDKFIMSILDWSGYANNPSDLYDVRLIVQRGTERKLKPYKTSKEFMSGF